MKNLNHGSRDQGGKKHVIGYVLPHVHMLPGACLSVIWPAFAFSWYEH
jgi:hypothetical protein